MDRRNVRAALALAALAAALLLAVCVGACSASLLHFAPAALVVLPLIAGRYLGEDVIAARVARRAGRSRSFSTAFLPARARASRRVAVRGTLLVASSLAERPPPALAS